VERIDRRQKAPVKLPPDYQLGKDAAYVTLHDLDEVTLIGSGVIHAPYPRFQIAQFGYLDGLHESCEAEGAKAHFAPFIIELIHPPTST
jgi:hypothetical protein